MAIKDPIAIGLESGWKVIDATKNDALEMEADVVIAGTGAGGGIAAEILSQAGLKVVLLEEGALRSSRDFKMDEPEAFATLYQQGAGRTTADGSIAIFQGRSVGGGTTVNWTSSFRTPDQTLNHWGHHHKVRGFSPEEMQPWFERVEKRLNIHKWAGVPNANNTSLQQGCHALGWKWAPIPRNVNGCWNLGYCGMGCPTNAKQSMLVTTIPASLDDGATLIHHCRADRFSIKGDKVESLHAFAVNGKGDLLRHKRIRIQARHYIVSCGAIGSPALLMRSGAPDPFETLGKRTFLHPSCLSMAEMPHEVDPFYGAPQTIYSDHFQWQTGATGPLGYKLEVTPMHPMFTALFAGGHGKEHQGRMEKLPNLQTVVALMRDGFEEASQGGQVSLNDDGSPILDYELNDYLWDGMRRAMLSMAELQFAAGAKSVRPCHQDAQNYRSWSEAKSAINTLPMQVHRTLVGSAHVMGGCTMGEDERRSVVNSDGQHHQLTNLSVFDGSEFPTSIGANPQESIYAMVSRQAVGLAQQMIQNSLQGNAHE